MHNVYFLGRYAPRLVAYVLTCMLGMLTAVPAMGQVSFRPPVNYDVVRDGQVQAAVGDINRDGKQDIVTVNYSRNSISVLLGDGAGAFSSATNYSTGINSQPFLVALGDVNNDGILDAVTTNESRSNSVLLGTSAGGFATARQYASGTNDQIMSMALGDVNNDGYLDLVVGEFGYGLMDVFLNNRRGEFSLGLTRYTTGMSTNPQGIALGDFNGDNSLDAAVACPSARASTEGVAILLNNGSGVFSAPVTYPVGGTGGSTPYPVDVTDVVCEDINGDGRLDVITGNSSNGTISVLIGRGNGSFMPEITYSGYTQGSRSNISIALGDINGDGKKDIVSIDQDRSLFGVLLSDGNGAFRPIVSTFATPMADQHPYRGVVADLNGDGKQDVVTANYYTNNITVFLNSTARPLAVNIASNSLAVNTYPNPAHGHVMLDLPLVAGFVQGSMKLSDALGRTVLSKILPLGKAYDVNLSGVHSGVYSLSILLGESVVVRKLVVE